MKVKNKIFVFALILSLILTVSCVAAAENMTFDQGDLELVSSQIDIEMDQNEDDSDILQAENQENENSPISGESETQLLSSNHTVDGDDFSSIQTVINDASEGDTIFLNAKTYIGSSSHIIINKNNLTIIGGTSMEDDAVSILDAQGNSRMMYINASNILIKGIKFINGKRTGSSGGAIQLVSGGVNFTLKDCIFINNTASQGGAVYAANSYAGSAIINCSFINNSARNSYGAVRWGAANSIFENCIFENNTAATYGGAMLVDGRNVTLKNSRFIKNSALNGGALYWLSTSSNSTLINCNFTNNSAKTYAGAVYWNAVNSTLTNCNFENNSAGSGGAIYMEGSNNKLNYSNFTDNTASLNGGAIYSNGTNINLTNVRFIKNSASNYGGAINFEGANSSVVGAHFENNGGNKYGGAIRFAKTAANPILTHITFNNNSASSGGALTCIGNNALINNVTFTNNKADIAPALALNSANTTIRNSYFVNNTSLKYGAGAISLDGVGNVLDTLQFINNSAYTAGGAIYSTCSNATYANIIFINNTAGSEGGALYSETVNATLINISFINNAATSGGAIYSKGYGLNITNARFINNNAQTSNGGAMHVAVINAAFNDLTFNNNSAAGAGGAIHITSSNHVINNCNFTNNTASANGGAINSFATNLTIGNSNFNNNTGVAGGAIRSTAPGFNLFNASFICNVARAAEGGAISMKSINATLSNLEFINNSAQFSSGGALYTEGNNVTLNKISFINNSAGIDGGAIRSTGPNFKIECANFTNNIANNNGGAVSMSSSNSTFNKVNFINNTAKTDSGGAVYMNGENSNLSNVNFTNNSAKVYGGAVLMGGDCSSIINANFISNTANQGGAVRVMGKNGTLTDSQFKNNNATRFAASVSWGAPNGVISDCSFINNTAGTSTGGIRLESEAHNTAVSNCSFENNVALAGGSAALYCTANNCSVKDSNFTNNSAVTTGGAVFWNTDGANGTMANCNFNNNNAADGGALNWRAANGNVTGCSFTNNDAVDGGAINWSGVDGTVSGSTFEKNNAREGGAIIWTAANGKMNGNEFTNNTAFMGAAVHSDGEGVTIDNNKFKDNKAEITGNNIWIDGPKNNITGNDINNTGYYSSGIYVTTTEPVNIQGNTFTDPNYQDVEYAIILIEVDTRFEGYIGKSINIPVYVHDSYGRPMPGSVSIVGYDSKVLSNGKATFTIRLPSTTTQINTFVKYDNEIKPITINVVDNPIGDITQPEGGNNSVVIKLLDDVTGNITVTIGDKNYTGEIKNSSAIINLTDLPKGIYAANVIYSGDENFPSATKNVTIVIKDSDVTFDIIVVGELIAHTGKTVQVSVSVVSSLGDTLPGRVTLYGVEYTYESVKALENGAAVFDVAMPEYKTVFDLVAEYNGVHKTIRVTVVDPSNPIGDITQPEGGNNTVVIELPGDAIGNVTVTIGDKNYTGEVKNGSAVINITDLPNGTYTANVTYPGDGNYSGVTKNITVVIKDSDVTFDIIVVGELIGHTGKTVQVSVSVVSSLGDTLPGRVTLYGVEYTYESVKALENGAAVFDVAMPEYKTVFDLVAEYNGVHKTIRVTVVDPSNPIGDITQPEGGNNSVVINLPGDATGNVTVTIGDKNYTGEIVNGTVVIDITDLPNGTYTANVTYPGDGNYSNISTTIPVVIKNSNVTIVIEVISEITGHAGQTLQIPVLVHTDLGDPLTGEVAGYGVGYEYSASEKLANGVAVFKIPMPEQPTTLTFMFMYNTQYRSVKVNVADTTKPIGDITQPDGDSDTVEIKFPADATGNVTVVIDGKNYTATIVNGSAVVNITDLPNGTYSATVIYPGDANYSNMTSTINIMVKNSNVKPPVPEYKLAGNGISVIYSGKATYKVLVTKDGKAAGAGESVTINFNGKNTVVKTNAQGYAILNLNTNVKPKTYTIKASIGGVSTTNNVKITQVIKASNKKVKKSKKVTKIKIKLKKVNGKYLKKKTLKIKFNKKTYKVKTNKKGVATWKVKKSMLKKLKVGKKVKYIVTYGKATLAKKLTIKK